MCPGHGLRVGEAAGIWELPGAPRAPAAEDENRNFPGRSSGARRRLHVCACLGQVPEFGLPRMHLEKGLL